MKRVNFVLFRETTDDAGRVNPDPAGNFNCTYNTAKFLDIEKLGSSYNPSYEVKPTKPASKIRATGEIVYSTKNASGVAASSTRPGRRGKGHRSIRLFTGKPNSTKTINKTFCTIGFRFPSMATILVIADALGSLIPANKISSSPGATEIYPEFKIVGGGTYGILTKSQAIASQEAVVYTSTATQQELDLLSAKIKAK